MNIRTVIGVLLTALTGYTQTPGTFTPAGNLTTQRIFHTATLLNNGKVLVAGGYASLPAWASAELYDPSIRTFTATGDMTSPRCFHTATLLPDGRVLIAGGFTDASEYNGRFDAILDNAELYDPATGRFSSTGNMTSVRARHTATLLNDGRVLIAGGTDGSVALATAELYDPVTGSFSATGAMTPGQFNPTSALLVNGKVLIIGNGAGPAAPRPSAELYDPDAGVFAVAGTTTDGVQAPATTTLLTNGKVLITEFTEEFTNGAEVYDPADGSFTRIGSQNDSRGHSTANLLTDGKVLITGEIARPYCDPSCNSAELYDPITGTFSAPMLTHQGIEGYAATLLLDGTVLLTGGLTTPTTTEIYHPAVLLPAPLLFAISGDGKGQGAIWHATNGQVASPSAPAVGGEILCMYTSGLVDGGAIPPQVAIGGRSAEILFFGDAPGYPGYFQVNFRVPSGVATGSSVPVRLTYLSRPSNVVTIGAQQ